MRLKPGQRVSCRNWYKNRFRTHGEIVSVHEMRGSTAERPRCEILVQRFHFYKGRSSTGTWISYPEWTSTESVKLFGFRLGCVHPGFKRLGRRSSK